MDGLKIFGSPRRYVQGPGALAQLGQLTASIGSHPLVVVDADVLPFVEATLNEALAGRDSMILGFRGEPTHAAIDALAEQARAAGANVVIGVGGGKGLDAAKGVARRIGLEFVSVPTIASNDSPTGRAIAIYDDHHVLVDVETIPDNPALVLVDTQIIANAPARFLRAGMGDAIAKKFEAERARADGARNFHDGFPLLTAMAIADCGYRTLREHGEAALRANERKVPDAAFEAVVEANVLMAGLGFESGGLSYAHAVVRGLVKARDIATVMHGDHVAYGTLVQLAIEDRDDAAILDLMGWSRSVGLPCSLADMGMANPTAEEMHEIARLTTIGPKGNKIEVRVGIEQIAAAIARVEALAAQG